MAGVHPLCEYKVPQVHRCYTELASSRRQKRKEKCPITSHLPCSFPLELKARPLKSVHKTRDGKGSPLPLWLFSSLKRQQGPPLLLIPGRESLSSLNTSRRTFPLVAKPTLQWGPKKRKQTRQVPSTRHHQGFQALLPSRWPCLLVLTRGQQIGLRVLRRLSCWNHCF